MSKSRFVFKQIPVRSSGGSSHSDLTRYVAKNKLDSEREGRNPRALFTEHDDKLSSTQARKFLSITGGALEKRDVLHYVLSFENGREYELLGDSEDERRIEVVNFMRSLLPVSFSSVGIAEMRWVAGIHRNTDNPHLHLLLNKNIIEKRTADLARIAKLPAPLIAHYEREKDGTKNFNNGMIINDFASQVDARHRERMRYLQFKNPVRDINFTRALLSPKTLQQRSPSAEETFVGRWIVEEIANARRTQSSLVRFRSDEENLKGPNAQERGVDLKQLREEVIKLDRIALENGQTLTEAFIDAENLRSILIAPPLNLKIFSSGREIPVTKSHTHKLDFIHEEPLPQNHESIENKTKSKDKSFTIASPTFNR